MEPNKSPVETNRSRTVVRFFQEVGNGLILIHSYALIGAMVLTAIWLTGRVMEMIHGNSVFDSVLTSWLGISIFLLLVLWALGSAIASVRILIKAPKRWLAVASWVFFLIVASAILIDLEGFRVSSSGLFATISPSTESAEQASFLLFKFHPANPMLPVNLLVSKLTGVLDIEPFVPYVWNSNYIFAFLIWSLVYSILLLIHKNAIWLKTIHLAFSAFGLGALILLKSTSSINHGQTILLHASAVMLLTFQVLLTHSLLRRFAAQGGDVEEDANSSTPLLKRDEVEIEKDKTALPPSGLKIALILFLFLPIIADLQHQFDLASLSKRMIDDIENSLAQPEFILVTAMTISVYAGPSIGDDVVGILPKGLGVPVVDKKYGWVCVGKNRWVPEKFLMPMVVAPETSKGGDENA